MSVPSPKPGPPEPSGPARRGLTIGVVGFLVALFAVASVGSDGGVDGVTNLLAVIDTWARAGWAPALFLISSYGMGRVFAPVIRESAHRAPVQLCLGLAVSLTVTHLVGVLGWLSPATSIGMIAVGCFLAVTQWSSAGHERRNGVRLHPFAVMLVIPLAIGVVAAASPPGWLWGSEFGGYDALSYHLQLPQEWLRSGRVWPAEHNVYSFLPSYLESTTVLLAHLTLAPIDSMNGHGLTAGTGWRAMMPQILHLMITACAAWAIGAFTCSMVRGLGDGESEGSVGVDRRAAFAGWVAGALTLATPWVVVVGTLAYNEMAVVLLGAGALLVVIEEKITPVWRGVLSALLVGIACGCKPTAILFVAPVVGIVLVANLPRARVLPAIGAGLLIGALTLSPWVIRNEIASGNPVFPAMTGVFGTGHFDEGAIARYAEAHTFDGSWLDRVRLLVWTDPDAGAQAPSVQRFRGFANPQWFALAPAGVIAMVMLFGGTRTRRIGMLLGVGLAVQVIAWGAFTHLQSRFLLPCVLTVVPAVGVMVSGVRGGTRAKRGSVVVSVLLVLTQTVASVVLFVAQRDGYPNARLLTGPSVDVGRPYTPELGALIYTAYLNNELPTGSVVYLLGDSTPFAIERPVIYNTTYDPWPLAEAIEADPDNPGSWTRHLRGIGVTHVLIAPGELARLGASGWITPAITPERVSEWLGTVGAPERVWPQGSASPARALYRLASPEDPTP